MHLYGLIIGIAVVVGLNYFEKNNTSIPKSKINLFIFGLLISILIGARAYHVIDTWHYYSQNLSQIINIPNGGLGIYGALLMGFLYLYISSFVFKLKILNLLDSITPILPLCQAIGRFGNYVNGEISIWWLEAILCFTLFIIIKRLSQFNPTGLYLIGYGVIRLITEYYRTDTWVISNFKIANLISIVFIIIGISIIKKSRKTGFFSL